MSMLDVIQNLSIYSVAIAAIAWVTRALTRQVLNRDLEEFKADLAKDAISFKITYERLQAERVEVTKEMYKKIVHANDSLRSLIKLLQLVSELPENAKAVIAKQHSDDLIDYFDENRIFFEESIAKEIDFLLLAFGKAWRSFHSWKEAGKAEDREKAVELWNITMETMSETVPTILKQLQADFRNTLGISNG